MAQIVQIDIGTYKDGINNLDDIVSVHDDDVELGIAYSSFKIRKVAGVTAETVIGKLGAKIPDIKTVYRSDAKWSFDMPEIKKVWKDPLDLLWKEVQIMPSYQCRLILSKEDDDILKSELTLKDDTFLILEKVIANIDIPSNKTMVEDLNTK